MAIVAYALPVVPGQEDRVRRFGAEIGERQAVYADPSKLPRAFPDRAFAWDRG